MNASKLVVLLATSLAATPALAGPRGASESARSAKAKVVETSVAVDAADEARKLAEAYLQAISGEGNGDDIESLLGGATLTARMYSIENWKIVGREEHREETGRIEDLRAAIDGIDKAGREALAKMVAVPADDDGLAVQELTAEEAGKLLGPTRARAKALTRSNPVFAYLARVDKQVYWHPKNPFRKLLEDAGASGPYQASIDLFWIETIEGAHADKRTRRWPLRVVRFTARNLDTGLKILPASDWNAE